MHATACAFPLRSPTTRPRQRRTEASRELPFVLAVPKSAADFGALVDGRPPTELAEAITRIRACNHAGLAAGNRERLQVRPPHCR